VVRSSARAEKSASGRVTGLAAERFRVSSPDLRVIEPDPRLALPTDFRKLAT
jgi:hypothetical protein